MSNGMTARELITWLEQQGEKQDHICGQLLEALKGYAEAREEYDALVERAQRLQAERCGLLVEAAMAVRDGERRRERGNVVTFSLREADARARRRMFH